MQVPRSLVVVLTSLAATIAVGVAPAQAADTVHPGINWTWTGPAAWTSEEDYTQLTVTGDKGALLTRMRNDGACEEGSTQAQRAKAFFRSQRELIEGGGTTVTKVRPITAESNGVRKRRLDYTFTDADDKPHRGLVVLSYKYLGKDGSTLTCRGSSDFRSSQAKHWAAKAPQLARISKSVVYSA